MDDNDLIGKIRDGESWAINQLYLRHKRAILAHLRSLGASVEISLTCYHDAILLLIKHIRAGRLDQNEGLVLPYIKRIAKFTWYGYCKKDRSKQVLWQEEVSKYAIGEESPLDRIVETEIRSGRLAILMEVMQSLGDNCRELITLSYIQFPPLTASEIAELMNYQSGGVVRQSRSRCVQKIKTRIMACQSYHLWVEIN